MKEYCGLICVEDKSGEGTIRYFECNAKSERHARGVLLCGALYHYPNTTVSTEYVSRLKGGKPVKHTDFKVLREIMSKGLHRITRDMTGGLSVPKVKPAPKQGQLIPFAPVVKSTPKADNPFTGIFSAAMLEQVSEEGTYYERK